MTITNKSIFELGFKEVHTIVTSKEIYTFYHLENGLDIVSCTKEDDKSISWYLAKITKKEHLIESDNELKTLKDIIDYITQKRDKVNEIIMENIQRYNDMTKTINRINDYCRDIENETK